MGSRPVCPPRAPRETETHRCHRRIRVATDTLYQELIDAEMGEFIDVGQVCWMTRWRLIIWHARLNPRHTLIALSGSSTSNCRRPSPDCVPTAPPRYGSDQRRRGTR